MAVIGDLAASLKEAAEKAVALKEKAKAQIASKVCAEGKLLPAEMTAQQHATHGLAWFATTAETLTQLADLAERLSAEGRLGDMERLVLSVAGGEMARQIVSAIPMNQAEFVRPADLGLEQADLVPMQEGAAGELLRAGNTRANRAELVALMREAQGHLTYGDCGLDEMLDDMREHMARFSRERVEPKAQEWHLADAYIPMDIIGELAELGVFGLTIPEEYGGLAMGKEAMCVVSEELSRGWIAVGSLGTRSEIAAELILTGGTEAQKERWLPAIASGETLPTAVFTEPNHGSDLAHLTTRAVRDGDVWRITGNKTWITHAARADLMTLLARTNPDEPGYKGLSMFLAEKPRGTEENPFPVEGLTGTEIPVLGYRGMKEFELRFENFAVPAENLLGEEEGQGFKQLMRTFEAARIQTAARAIGVAQSALDLGLRYAEERIQFGRPIIDFPRVADKLALMAAEIMAARQITYYAAREKDAGRRCDMEAGMAKLLAARVAWAAADNAVQIHGGNGFALEFPVSRVLCDARILNIFEGAAEIQAEVIARRLLES
ncbi:acyl-CoA dehydrogenase family protein [Thermopetrobacter sp. TC1]|uniref:acyl-CoA dehydrogenase family protein n=1 Tax=Thermopetrobacter sp. TC1 TaxID=1495045 RepID=UPI00056E3087|nr:acyl-CoA dehydrogenase family protein [Thermopetrobacter sp. TC1]